MPHSGIFIKITLKCLSYFYPSLDNCAPNSAPLYLVHDLFVSLILHFGSPMQVTVKTNPLRNNNYIPVKHSKT